MINALICSGKICNFQNKPELEKLLSQIRASDTLVVCKLDRLARSTHHLLEIVETLREKKLLFIPWVSLGQIPLLMQIFP